MLHHRTQKSALTRILPFLAFLLLPLLSIRAEEPPAAVPSGVTCQLIRTLSVDELNEILTTKREKFFDFPITFPAAKDAVNLYRITYRSVIPEQGNRPTAASGLLALPATKSPKPLPVVSYQHGTVFSRSEVPSQPMASVETQLVLALFASQGYAVVAADYFGKGYSNETDSYLVKGSTQQACLDMLRAAQATSIQLGVPFGPIFLSGWSQGGWATMAFLEKLEALGVPVRAAAVASAPLDLYSIINGWLHQSREIDAAYLPALLALQLNAYEEYYGLPGLANSAIKPEYQKAARALYLNEITWEESKLPTRLSDFLEPDFIRSSSAGTTRYWQIVRDNQAWQWRLRTPLRTYWGGADEVTPEYIASLPVASQKSMGGAPAAAVAAGEKATHRGTFLKALADQKAWFDALRGQ